MSYQVEQDIFHRPVMVQTSGHIWAQWSNLSHSWGTRNLTVHGEDHTSFYRLYFFNIVNTCISRFWMKWRNSRTFKIPISCVNASYRKDLHLLLPRQRSIQASFVLTFDSWLSVPICAIIFFPSQYRISSDESQETISTEINVS